MKQWVMESDYGRLALEESDGRVFVHTDIWKWSPSIAKDVKRRMKAVEDYLRQYNVKRIFTVVPAQDGQVNKFQTMHGFVLQKEHEGMNFYMKEINHGC